MTLHCSSLPIHRRWRSTLSRYTPPGVFLSPPTSTGLQQTGPAAWPRWAGTPWPPTLSLEPPWGPCPAVLPHSLLVGTAGCSLRRTTPGPLEGPLAVFHPVHLPTGGRTDSTQQPMEQPPPGEPWDKLPATANKPSRTSSQLPTGCGQRWTTSAPHDSPHGPGNTPPS